MNNTATFKEWTVENLVHYLSTDRFGEREFIEMLEYKPTWKSHPFLWKAVLQNCLCLWDGWAFHATTGTPDLLKYSSWILHMLWDFTCLGWLEWIDCAGCCCIKNRVLRYCRIYEGWTKCYKNAFNKICKSNERLFGEGLLRAGKRQGRIYLITFLTFPLFHITLPPLSCIFPSLWTCSCVFTITASI